MKKNNFKILALFFLAAFSLSSCSSDSSGDSNGTTTGDYFPMAVNNKWDYTDGSIPTEINLTGTDLFGGNTYYRFTDTGSDAGVQTWITKKGASYYQKTAPTTQTDGSVTITVQGFEIKMFRDDLQAGESWSGKASPKVTFSGPGSSGSITAKISYEGHITARDASVTLGGITYTNVIKMEMVVTEKVDTQTTIITGENWFAKDIGLIYDKSTTSTDNVTETRYLTSYTLH